MEELILKGTCLFNGLEVPIIEGGFSENEKCILAKTVAEVHGVSLRQVNQLININKSELDEGVDIIDIKEHISANDLFLSGNFLTKAQWGNAKNIYLLSEQGYMAVTILMRTKKAKELRKQFRREYFYMRKVISQLVDSYMIEDPIERAKAWIKEKEKVLLLEQQNEEQLNIIEEMKPKVEVYDDFLKESVTYLSTELAKEYGLNVARFHQILNQEKIIYKCGKKWYPYQKYAELGVMKLVEAGTYEVLKQDKDGDNIPDYKISKRFEWTPFGRVFIYEYFSKKLNIYPVSSHQKDIYEEILKNL